MPHTWLLVSEPTDIPAELVYEEDGTIALAQSNRCGQREIKAIGTASFLALVKVVNMLTDLSQKVSNGMNKYNLKTMYLHSGKPWRHNSFFRLLRSSSLKCLECQSPQFTPAEIFSSAICKLLIINMNIKFLKEQIQKNISLMKIIKKCSAFQIPTSSKTVLWPETSASWIRPSLF